MQVFSVAVSLNHLPRFHLIYSDGACVKGSMIIELERLDYRRHLLLLSVKLCITKSRYGCRLLGVQQREKWARILSMLDSLYPPPLSSENTTTRSYNQRKKNCAAAKTAKATIESLWSFGATLCRVGVNCIEIIQQMRARRRPVYIYHLANDKRQ
ncbi:hypothetical protein OUZ56_013850 [Daphnia magna]|uniref:Uncharacterized protein n=1 Tax=Daphnia magna TaxID=35525 RepID=A0ABQ9Z744_9CRUS|nr:hypothetical protein OUZ56_013850 [Daphnia magna]